MKWFPAIRGFLKKILAYAPWLEHDPTGLEDTFDGQMMCGLVLLQSHPLEHPSIWACMQDVHQPLCLCYCLNEWNVQSQSEGAFGCFRQREGP